MTSNRNANHNAHHNQGKNRLQDKNRLKITARSLLGILLILGTMPMQNLWAQTAEEGHGTDKADLDLTAKIEALDRLQSVKNIQPLQANFPKIEHFYSKNGVPVAFVRSTSLPIVDASLQFRAGSARDGDIRKNAFGIANMVATMLTQGTKNLSEDEFNQQVEDLGIELSSMASKDAFVVSLRSLSDQDHLSPAVDLVAQMLRDPKFDESILKRNQDRFLIAVQQGLQNPAEIAHLAFYRHLYGDHPYANPTLGTLESIPTLTRADLQAFKDRFLVAQNANLAITGNLTLAQARALADQITAPLAQGKKVDPLADPKPVKGGRIHLPFDSTQTTVIMGQLGDKRSADKTTWQAQTDFALANDILAGGNFNARLMKEIRKKRGYTYGIYGTNTPMIGQGSYKISFSTRNDKAEDAIAATLETIKQTQKQGIRQAELQLTKDSFKNSFPTHFASNASINSTVGMLGFYGLEDDFIANSLQRIDKTDQDSANQALKKLKPDEFLIITVGDLSDKTAKKSDKK